MPGVDRTVVPKVPYRASLLLLALFVRMEGGGWACGPPDVPGQGGAHGPTEDRGHIDRGGGPGGCGQCPPLVPVPLPEMQVLAMSNQHVVQIGKQITLPEQPGKARYFFFFTLAFT